MDRIIRIFVHDIIGLSRNIFALIIAVGLCIIPSLYAWFNIYSNWDPYASTSSIKVAVVSDDKGSINNNVQVNMGEAILDNLRNNTGLGWQILDDKDKAIEGVKSGEYYAAIVIGEDFSDNLVNFIENGMARPSVTYYENEKKNAVASKITDTGKSTLQENINTQFIDTVVNTALNSSEELFKDYKSVLSGIVNNLTQLNDNLNGYNATITAFVNNNAELSDNLKDINSQIPGIQNILSNGSDNSIALQNNASEAAKQYSEKLDTYYNDIQNIENEISDKINALINSLQQNVSEEEINSGIDEIIKLLDALITDNDALAQYLTNISEQLGGVVSADVINSVFNTITTTENTIKALLEQSKTLVSQGVGDFNSRLELTKIILQQCKEKTDELNKITNSSLKNVVSIINSSVSSTLTTIGTSLNQISRQLDTFSSMLGSTQQSVDGMSVGLNETQTIINGLTGKISTITERLNGLSKDETVEILKQALTRQPEVYGEFMSSPVKIDTHQIFATSNYGSAVAPFYTTLALWVGGLLLTALIKVHPDEKKLVDDAKEHELFFGRYLLFFVMGQVQAFITVWGDLYLLKIQCMNKGLFLFAACFTSFVFTLLIYTLTLSFGDIGKALAVVMVVIQIAGSSGTYPIELLTSFFQKVYIYFPFPYAINAMRETISGMYGGNYWMYIFELMIFAIVSLAVGLVIRKPFIKLNHYMHKRMKDTEMM